MTVYKIAVLEGDGIGPEITQEAIKILEFVGSRNQIEFELNYAPFGAAAYSLMVIPSLSKQKKSVTKPTQYSKVRSA